MKWFLATEDALSHALARKLLIAAQSNAEIEEDLGQTGNARLCEDMLNGKYCSLEKLNPVLLLTDLDQKSCAPILKKEWCRDLRMPRNSVFRIVVREAETWLMADLDAFSHFSGISKGKFPKDVEIFKSPKEQMLNLIRKYGNRKVKDILPRKGSTAKVSPNYNNILVRFVEESWNPKRASLHSPSLKKAIHRVSQIIA